MINIEENISLLNKKIEKKTSIIAVSKKKSAELVEQAYLLGIKNFGENYLQEALQKIISNSDFLFNRSKLLIPSLILKFIFLFFNSFSKLHILAKAY